ncbi:MAG: FprA family A-type flavoprotein [Alphaproteobacteria bacterium]|nr:FprA family A-type flavoprotein [Alphaproteobacteria bacterium]
MKAVEIKKGIYWVGVKDWNLREFHGYTTSRGSTYNAYLIVDDKITLIDGVKAPFTDELMRRIASVIDPEKIDVVICNHVEMDHSGALPAVMAKAENAMLYCPLAGERGLKMHYDTTEWKIQTVKTGDTLNIGKHTLSFVQMPMVHWPDSMMTYVADEKLLFPNDGFGQHYACDEMFDDVNFDIVMEEAKKYYGNIVWPYGAQVQKVLEEAAKLDIDMIAPSHGVIWRKHIPEIIEKYKLWSSYGHVADKAVVVYDSMWGSTEKMAQEVAAAWIEKGLKVTLCSLKHSNISDAINDIVEAKYVALGSPTLNSGILPTMGAFLTYLKGLAAKNKVSFCFGSYGWKKDAQSEMQDILTKLGWELPEPIMTINWRPTAEGLRQLHESALKVIKE